MFVNEVSRRTLTLVGTNRLFHAMLRDGVPVEYRRKDGTIAGDSVRLIDFSAVEANDWFAVNQFAVVEGPIDRRPDVVVFVNGLPLGVLELKNRRGRRRHHIRCVQGSPNLQGADSVSLSLQCRRRRFRWYRRPDRDHQRPLGAHDAVAHDRG